MTVNEAIEKAGQTELPTQAEALAAAQNFAEVVWTAAVCVSVIAIAFWWINRRKG